MIAVVGSVNQDLVARVEHHPVPGETVLGSGHETMPGGKGANQAVAAARLGTDVVFVGRIGADEDGRDLVGEFEREGVDVEHLVVDPEAPSGLAIITVDDAGENAIVVSPGANGNVCASDVEGASAVLMAATVTLLQLEIPMDAVQCCTGCSPSGGASSLDRRARRQSRRARNTHRIGRSGLCEEPPGARDGCDVGRRRRSHRQG